MLKTFPRDSDHEWLLRAVKVHRAAVKSGEGVLKDEHKTTITRILCDDRGAVVKHYRPMGLRSFLKGLFQRHPGERSRGTAEVMRQRAIPTPEVLGLVVRPLLGLTAESWLVTETVENAIEMDRYILRRFGDPGTRLERREFLRKFAEALRLLIGGGIRHNDLKTCNILVVEESAGWRFLFIDLDYAKVVEKGSSVAREFWAQALSHLNSSTPKCISWTDRLHFLNEIPELSAFDRRRLIAEVQELSRRRGRVYIGDEGPVELDLK